MEKRSSKLDSSGGKKKNQNRKEGRGKTERGGFSVCKGRKKSLIKKTRGKRGRASPRAVNQTKVIQEGIYRKKVEKRRKTKHR